MQNPDIARVFDEVADLLEIQDANPFRVRAYRNAARTLRDFPEPIAELVRVGAKDLTEISGIGADLAEKITAIVTTGELPLRKQLAAKLPPGLLDLLRIPGLGPKRVKLLHKKLKVKSATDLAAALAKHRIQKLKGFGPKIEEKIRTGLGVAEHSERRLLLHEAETAANAIVASLRASGGISQIEVAGSYRRRRETIGDLDILVTSGDSPKVMERFVSYGEVAEGVSQGETRSSVKLQSGLQVDLRAVEPAAYGAALQYFTGSKAHNVELRKIAQEQGYKLNEYGLFKGTRRVAARPRRRSTPGSASTGCHPSCAKHAARSPSPASTGSPGSSSSRTSAATSRCTRARPTARGRSTRWPKRREPSSTNTSPSPTTRSA